MKLIRAFLLQALLITSAHCGSYFIDPRDPPYSAACDGATDDTIPLQTALNDASSQQLSLFVPPKCWHSGTLLNNGVDMFGVGRGRSGLTMTNGALPNMQVVSGSPSGGGSVHLRDFYLTYSVTPTAGSALLVDPGGSNVNTGSLIDSVSIPVAWDGIDFERAAFWTVRDPLIGEPTLSNPSKVLHRGIVVRNLVDEDYGDSLITGGLVAVASGAADIIYQESSAGLKIGLTKMVGSAENCFHFHMVSTRAMGPLIGVGNSLEGCLNNGAIFEQSSPSASLSMNEMVWVGNQIGSGAGNAFVGVNIVSGGVTWLRNAAIGLNPIMANQVTSMGGVIADGIDSAMIEGNPVFNNSGPVTGYSFISGAWMRNGYMGKNSIAYPPTTAPEGCSIAPPAAGNPGPQIRFETASPCL